MSPSPNPGEPSEPGSPLGQPDPANQSGTEPSVTAARPGWLPVTRPPQADRPAGEQASGPGAASESTGSPTPPGTDPAADRKLFANKATTFTTIAGAGLEAIGGLLNIVAGAGTPAFIPDEDDMASVPPPVGRILARRVKTSEDANLSETADMIAAGIGLAAWLAKGLLHVVDARIAARRQPQPGQAPAGTVVPGQVVDGQQAGPA